METSLHRSLKSLYAGPAARTEVRLDGYRIDAVVGRKLVEIQHGSLAAIRDKARRLVESHRLLIVKPIVARKVIVRDQAGVQRRRVSPKRGGLLDIFDELVYFTGVFPQRRLALEIVLVEVEEFRAPGHGRRRRWRPSDHVVVDQRLTAVNETRRLTTAADLVRLLPSELPAVFDSGDLATTLGVRRHVAQRIAYCLRETGAARVVGKKGNAWLYATVRSGRRSRAA
jgi:hypothetical protein